MTPATFAECARAVHASGLDPIGRSMLLAALCEGLPVDAERMAWAGSVGTLAAAAGAGVTAVKARLGALTQAGVVTVERLAGAPAYIFALKAIGRETAGGSRETAPIGRETTVDGHLATDSLRLATDDVPSAVAGRETAAGGRVATDAGRVATGVEDGTALAIHAHAGAPDSLLGSFQEPLYLARARAEVVVDLASAPPHEAPPAAGLASAMTSDVMASLGELEAARGWQFVPPVWVDAAIASATVHGAEATAAAIRSIAAWAAPKTPGGRGGIPKVEWLAERAKTASERSTLAPTPAGGGTWRGGRAGGLAGRAEVMADAVKESQATQAARVAWSQTPDGREHAERIAATLREQAADPLLAGM